MKKSGSVSERIASFLEQNGLPPLASIVKVVDVLMIVAAVVWVIMDRPEYLYLRNVFLIQVLGPFAIFMVLHLSMHYSGFHEKYGLWKTQEPKSHLKFSLQTSWIIPLYTFGNHMTKTIFRIPDSRHLFDPNYELPFEVSKEQMGVLGFLVAPPHEEISKVKNIMVAFALFYGLDFLRYWGHRLGHDYTFLYRTFPFTHGSHHVQIFMNPATWMQSPFIHIAGLGTLIPVLVALALKWRQAVIYSLFWIAFSNWSQHLACDPFPWLTRWNHQYFYGALPWVPVYHAYHHLYSVKQGNFGNTTVLFDYMFGTVIPESVHHAINGEPPASVKKFFADPELDKNMEKNFVGGGKNRMDWNF